MVQKKENQDFPKIVPFGEFNEKSEDEITELRLTAHEGHCGYFYEIENNELILELIGAYRGEYKISNHFFEYWEEDELAVLDEFFDQFDEKSKLITFGHDGEPVFIIFFSEDSLREVTSIVENK